MQKHQTVPCAIQGVTLAKLPAPVLRGGAPAAIRHRTGGAA